MSFGAPDDKPVVVVEALRKVVVRGKHRACVLDIQEPLSIPRGKVTCVLGDSGSGKTTLLSIVGLIDLGFEGAYHLDLDGEGPIPIHDRTRTSGEHLRKLRRRIGFVFQDHNLRLETSAIQNIVDPLIYLGLGDRQSRLRNARKYLEHMGIGKNEDVWQRCRIAAFSGGMQQRIAIARALAGQPRLICADEPTANVDEPRAESLYREFRGFTERGITVVIVTHNRERARRYADYIIEIEALETLISTGPVDVKAVEPWAYRVRAYENEPSVQGILREDPLSSGRTTNSHPDDSSDPPDLSLSLTPWRARVADVVLEACKEVWPAVPYTAAVLWRAALYMIWGLWCDLVRGLVSLAPWSKGPSSPPASGKRQWKRATWEDAGPVITAFLVFLVLSAAAVVFYTIKQGMIRYQDDRIQQIHAVRRVRVKDPGDAAGQRRPFPLDEALAFVHSKGLIEVSAFARDRVMAKLLRAEDIARAQREGDGFLREFLGSRQVLSTDPVDEDRRFAISFVGIVRGGQDRLADDFGISQAQLAPVPVESGEVPALIVRPSDLEWVDMGGLLRPPRDGDEIVFAVVAKVDVRPRASPGQQRAFAGRRPVLAIRARVRGQVRERTGGGLVRPAEEHQGDTGVLDDQVVDALVAWQYDPIHANATVPRAWIYGTSFEPASLQASEVLHVITRPSSDYFDFYVPNPRQIRELVPAIHDFAKEKGIVFGEIESLTDSIEAILKVMNVIDLLGWVLLLVPMLVSFVVLWLVLHALFARKRRQLLLFLIMGAPPAYLYVLVAMIASLICVPSTVFGMWLGASAPQWLLGAPDLAAGLPEEFAAVLSSGSLELRLGLVVGLIVAASVFAISWSIVRALVRVNPSDVLRGNA